MRLSVIEKMPTGIAEVADVPIDDIHYSCAYCYIREGFGGNKIDKWPIYAFFLEFLTGNEEAAKKNFSDWYYDQFRKYCHMPKKNGGMKNGSLYKLIVKEHYNAYGSLPENILEVDESVIKNAIKHRVELRVNLLNVIRSEGYLPDRINPVIAVADKGMICLHEGHHRAAILKALNHDVVPGVLIFKNAFVFNIMNKVKDIWRIMR